MLRGLPSPSAGFSLIELVVTIALSTIVISFVSLFISVPIEGFDDQSRRIRLVDSADVALGRLARDVRRALPNSVRVRSNGGVQALEILGAIDGARYRAAAPGGPDRILDFAAADDSFNVYGGFREIALPFSSTAHHLAIYNVGVPGASAWETGSVMTPAGTTISVSSDALAGRTTCQHQSAIPVSLLVAGPARLPRRRTGQLPLRPRRRPPDPPRRLYDCGFAHVARQRR